MAKFRLTAPHFIEPNYFKTDTVIEYHGAWQHLTPFMEPEDAEAESMLKEYYKAHPRASIGPVEDLPLTVATVAVPEPAQVVNPIVKGTPSTPPPKPTPPPAPKPTP
jgi:hypothetical protein